MTIKKGKYEVDSNLMLYLMDKVDAVSMRQPDNGVHVVVVVFF